jgi:hypothetical protein
MNVIAYESLKIDRQIGQGNFGVVNLAYWNGKRLMTRSCKHVTTFLLDATLQELLWLARN